MKKPFYIRWILIAAICLFAAGVAQAAGVVPSEPEVQAQAYTLGPGDKIRVTVYGEEALSGVYGISAQGTLSFPLLGEVKAAGLTLPALEHSLVAGLKDGFLVNPSVAMEMESYRPFYIMGEVREPGSYDYAANISVLNAVALAGGFTYRANRSTVEVMRKNGEREVTLDDVDVESVVQPGDTILVKERFF